MIGDLILKLRAGDIVEIQSESEIQASLDADGSFQGVPFMPEMRKFCGKRFRVLKRAQKICVEGSPPRCMRDAVILEGVRCDGEAHDSCRRLCTIFWKEAWLKRVTNGQKPVLFADWLSLGGSEVPPPINTEKVYSCQSTRLLAATEHLSGWDFRQYVRDVWYRNFTIRQVFRALFIMAYNRVSWAQGGLEYGAALGKQTTTPSVALNLQPGEFVEIKSREEIVATLDPRGKNRGLQIDYETLRHCGKRFRVLKRIDRIILETTGKMREIKNTVVLENTECEGLCRRACARVLYPMWREAWLDRVKEPSLPESSRGD